MSGWGRWSVVTGVLAALIALPAVVAQLPVAEPEVPVDTLLARVRASAGVPYSGFAETLGTLAVPTGRGLSELTDLFGSHTRLRVWRRGPTDYRVDRVDPVGEHGTYRDATGAWLWDFAANRVSRTTQPDITPPTAPDLVPADLGRRLLSEATSRELHRLPARRIAGRTAAGLRLHPTEPGATVDRVDAWVDPGTGLALRVELWAKNAAQPALQSAFLDLHLGRPAARTTLFRPPGGAQVAVDNARDIGELAAPLGSGELPDQLAGLPLRPDALGIGAYGHGPTLLAAVPLTGEGGHRLRYRIGRAPGAVLGQDDSSTALAAGPLSLLVADVDGQSWLFTGTVAVATLRRAAAELGGGRP